MTTVLILTVGGSHQPLLRSIEEHRPDRVEFLCSDDAGKLKGSYAQVEGEGNVLKSDPKLAAADLPCLATLAGLDNRDYRIHKIDQFDDLNRCYLVAARVIGQARQEAPEARLVVDYTGGTKSMTAGLAAAALDDGRCEIALVVGRRSDLVKVQDQTEFVRPLQVLDAQMVRRILVAREPVERYDYASAEKVLRAAARRFAGQATLERVQRGIALCRAFDAWDRFDHQTARRCLDGYQGRYIDHWRVLKVLAGEAQGHGFERVEDLLLNAERRAAQDRYDDAVGRVYRAVELTAQVWLKERYDVETGDVDLAKAPEPAREKLARYRQEPRKEGQTGKVAVALLAAWDLIAAYPDDPIAAMYAGYRNRLLTFLEVRNQSLFAHGFRPIGRAEYDAQVPPVRDWLTQAIQAAIAALGRKRPMVLPQFPTDLLDEK